MPAVDPRSEGAALTPAAREPNVLHAGPCDAAVGWSTHNAGEALPGVVTPLTWTFFGDAVERAMRGAFADMGVLRERECVAPGRTELRLWDLHYGRAAGNLATFRRLGDLTPGTSGAAIEAQIFGAVREDAADTSDRRRYPAVAAKLPLAAARCAGRLRAATAEIRPWWQAAVRPGRPTDLADGQALLHDAAARFERVMRPHTLAAMLCQGLYDQILGAARRAGRAGLETSLVTGYGDMAETVVVRDLWDVSRDRLTLDEFVRRHGFHGPNEGDLAARVWRLDRSPLDRLLVAYRAMPDDRAPGAVEAGRGDARRLAEAELLGALPRWQRPPTRALLRVAGSLVPLRGVGKAGFLQCVDAARAAARACGTALTATGALDREEDVFFLTVAELVGCSADDRRLGPLATARRAVWEEYRAVELPEVWHGTAVPRPVTPGASSVDEGPVTGTPVAPGVVEGRVRVIVDADGDEDLEPGEILVCRTTDPSWASLMMVASALVIDIGGPVSHGAIVARELGIPCVIGTRDGTRRLRTGDHVRVDGGRGTVELLSPHDHEPDRGTP